MPSVPVYSQWTHLKLKIEDYPWDGPEKAGGEEKLRLPDRRISADLGRGMAFPFTRNPGPVHSHQGSRLLATRNPFTRNHPA
jgi:hypothetical protein